MHDSNVLKLFHRIVIVLTHAANLPVKSLIQGNSETNRDCLTAIIRAMDPHAYSDLPVEHINYKGSNNLIESDHATLKRIINPAKGFQTLRTAKPTIQAIEAFRTIKRGDLREQPSNAAAEIRLMKTLFNIAA